MKKFRAAVWQYYKRFLPLFVVCAVVSLIFQWLWREPIGEVFPVGIPFFSPFFFLFVLCTSSTLDRLFLQMHLPHRTQQKAFWAFLPTALLGAGVSVAIARWVSAGTPKRSGYDIYTVSYYFQTSLFGNEIFGGSMARITWLSFLLCALSLLVALLAARVLFVFWKSAAWKSLLLLGIYLLADFGLRWFTAYSEYTADMFLLEGLHTFLFGNAYAAPSLFCAKAVQLTVLSLCLSIGNRFGSKEQHKENFQGKTVFTVLRGVAVCAVTVLGICAVYYCTPVAVNHYEIDEQVFETRKQPHAYAYTATDFYISKNFLHQPDEKAYRLLQTQEKFAEEPYQLHIARHIADKYYAPHTNLPYTDFESGKRYYETYLNARNNFSCTDRVVEETGEIFSELQFPASDVSSIYCRWLYDNGKHEEAFAYYKAIPKENPERWLPALGRYIDLPAYLDAPSAFNNFLWYLYTNPNQEDAVFAAREIVPLISHKTVLTDADEGIRQFSALWDYAKSDAVRAYLAEALVPFATEILDNTAPYLDKPDVQNIRTELKQLCEKAGVEDRLPNGI